MVNQWINSNLNVWFTISIRKWCFLFHPHANTSTFGSSFDDLSGEWKTVEPLKRRFTWHRFSDTIDIFFVATFHADMCHLGFDYPNPIQSLLQWCQRHQNSDIPFHRSPQCGHHVTDNWQRQWKYGQIYTNDKDDMWLTLGTSKYRRMETLVEQRSTIYQWKGCQVTDEIERRKIDD
jgi:hypothetical protein